MTDTKKNENEKESTLLDLKKQVDDVQRTLFEAEEIYRTHEAAGIDVQYIFDKGDLLARQNQVNLSTTKMALDLSEKLLHFVTTSLEEEYAQAEATKKEAEQLYQEELEKQEKLKEKLGKEVDVIKETSNNLDAIIGNLVKIRIDFEEANEELLNLAEGTARYRSVKERMMQAQDIYNQTLEIQNALFHTLTLAVRTKQEDKAKLNSLKNSVNMTKAAAEAAAEAFHSLNLIQTVANEMVQHTTSFYIKAEKQVESNRKANEQAGEALKHVKSVLAEDSDAILEIKQHLTDLTVQLMEEQQKENLKDYLFFADERDSDPSYGLSPKKSSINQYREKLLLDDQTAFQEGEGSEAWYGARDDYFEKLETKGDLPLSSFQEENNSESDSLQEAEEQSEATQLDKAKQDVEKQPKEASKEDVEERKQAKTKKRVKKGKKSKKAK